MGTISNKLTYLNETKQKLKNDLNKFGAELTENDTFRSYSNVLNDIYDKLPRVTGNGSSFTLEDAQNGYLDDFKMYGNTEQDTAILPSGYTQVEYLESTGTQYIDTGINTNSTTSRYETKIKPSSVSGTMGIFGTRNYSSANQSAMNAFIISGNFRLDWLSGNGNYNVRNISSDTEYTISITRGLATINNVDYTSGETTSIDSTYPFYIGSFNNAGSVFSTGFSGKIYYSKLYNNNILIFDGVPCYRNSDNEIGMYDLVSNTFFTNQGTGTFNVGPVVSIPNPDYPQDVRVVTGNNSVNVIGKNLAKSYVNGDSLYRYSHSLYVDADFEVGKKYAISFVDKSVGNLYYRNEYLMQNVSSYSITATGERQTYYFECKSNDKTDSSLYVEGKGFAIFKNNAVLEQLPQFEDIQIEEVTSYDIPSTPYEPYQSQTYPINLGTLELCKIPNTSYQDIIFHAINGDSFYDTLDNATKQTLTYGKWYKHSEIGKVVLDGSENWKQSSVRNCVHNILISDILPVANNSSKYVNGISDKFINNVSYDDLTGASYKNYYNRMSATNDRYLSFSYETTTSISDWKTWLSTHNTIVYYVLATPTNTEITDTTLISQLNAIETYTGTNTFSVSNSNDVLPTLEVSRLKELDKLN